MHLFKGLLTLYADCAHPEIHFKGLQTFKSLYLGRVMADCTTILDSVASFLDFFACCITKPHSIQLNLVCL